MGKLHSSLWSYEEWVRRSLIWAVMYFTAEWLALDPTAITDADIWSHLRTGEWIVRYQWVPSTDPFSSFGMGRPWVAYSWLFEVLVFGLHHVFGLVGLLVFVCIMVLGITAGLHALIRKFDPRIANAVLLTAFGLIAMAPLYTPRPWLFTILLFVIELNILIGVRHSRNYGRLYLLPLLFALWANLHIQFVLGFSVLFIAACEVPIFRLLGKLELTGGEERGLPPLRVLLVILACMVAALVNPYHFRIYGVVLDYLRQPALYSLVKEFAAMDFQIAPNWFVLFLTLSAAFALGRQPLLRPFWILLFVAAVLVSFRSGRDVWFVVIIAVAVISASRPETSVGKAYMPSLSQVLVIIAVLALLLLLIGKARRISEANLQIVVARTYPDMAARFVEERGYPGPLYNRFDWGSYLIWRLPNLPVSIDGRTNVHDVNRTKRSIRVWNGMPGWASDPELSASRLVIAEKYVPLTQLLRMDSRFELVYEDEIAVVFISRNTSTK